MAIKKFIDINLKQNIQAQKNSSTTKITNSKTKKKKDIYIYLRLIKQFYLK